MSDETLLTGEAEATPEGNAVPETPASDANSASAETPEKDEAAKALTEAGEPGDADVSEDGDAEETDEGDQPVTSPDDYADFSLPEGFEVDETLLGEARERFAGLGLSQKQAQGIVDYEVERMGKAAEAQAEAWNAVTEEWKASVKADKEIGGAEMDRKLGVAKAVLDEFGTKELRETLDLHGYGNHPEIVRLLYRVGNHLKPPEAPSAAPVRDDSQEAQMRRLYPTHFTKENE